MNLVATRPASGGNGIKAEAWFALGYYALYMVWMFVHPEGELLHWLSLVILPFALVCLYRRTTASGWSFSDSLSSVGLRKGNLKTGLIWAGPFGLSLSLALQLLLSRDQNAFRELIVSGRFLYLAPLAFLLLLATVGFTEEFFFRGVLQTRLAALLRSNILAILAVSVLFALYHLPYAYLNPAWPSHGNLGAALGAAMGNGLLGGTVLGSVYVLARGNLMAAIIVHALIDLLPAMTQIKFG